MTDPHYPRGKISPDDQGEAGIRIGVHNATKTVIVDFMKPVIWVGFSARDARHIASMINEAAEEAERLEQAAAPEKAPS